MKRTTFLLNALSIGCVCILVQGGKSPGQPSQLDQGERISITAGQTDSSSAYTQPGAEMLQQLHQIRYKVWAKHESRMKCISVSLSQMLLQKLHSLLIVQVVNILSCVSACCNHCLIFTLCCATRSTRVSIVTHKSSQTIKN